MPETPRQAVSAAVAFEQTDDQDVLSIATVLDGKEMRGQMHRKDVLMILTRLARILPQTDRSGDVAGPVKFVDQLKAAIETLIEPAANHSS